MMLYDGSIVICHTMERECLGIKGQTNGVIVGRAMIESKRL